MPCKECSVMDERLQFAALRLAGEEMADIPSTGIAGGRSSRNSSMADPKGAAWSRNDKSHLCWRKTVCDFDSLVGPGLT
jgi:hypothetical protein